MSDLPDGFEILFGGQKPRRDTEECPRCHSSASVTGVEVVGIYDGVCYWRCEKCRVKWHRFGPRPANLRAAVERYWEDCK